MSTASGFGDGGAETKPPGETDLSIRASPERIVTGAPPRRRLVTRLAT